MERLLPLMLLLRSSDGEKAAGWFGKLNFKKGQSYLSLSTPNLSVPQGILGGSDRVCRKLIHQFLGLLNDEY